MAWASIDTVFIIKQIFTCYLSNCNRMPPMPMLASGVLYPFHEL